jgi:hypothetical protein
MPKKKPSMVDDLTADGVLNPNAPFEHHVQWVYLELWPMKVGGPAMAPA